jgi:DNA-binding transcriptional MerR regulator
MNSSLKLDELASRAGVSPRTVRYYIQRGILPPAEFRGPDTAYDERHLYALRAIKRLQEDYLPLDAIASALAGKSESELRRIVERGLPHTAKVVAREEAKPREARRVRGERVKLGDGIELWVEEGADRSLVDALVKLAKERS